MTGRERCEEIMRLIDEALESVPPAAKVRSRARQPGRNSESRPAAQPAGSARR